jgi:hypothetical protein
MKKFVTQSVPGLLAIATVAGLGYVVLSPIEAPAEQTLASAPTFHDADCVVCRHARFATGAKASTQNLSAPSPEAVARPSS